MALQFIFQLLSLRLVLGWVGKFVTNLHARDADARGRIAVACFGGKAFHINCPVPN